MNDWQRPPYDTSRHGATAPDVSRQVPTEPDAPLKEPDLEKFSHSVLQAVADFRKEGLSVSERTIQRYCHSDKLSAIKINPDTRQLTTDQFFAFMIDPSSIPDRIAQLREKQDFTNPTVVATPSDTSRHVATSPDVARHDELEKPTHSEGQGATAPDSVAILKEKIAELEAKNYKLEIDKAVGERLYTEVSKDRTRLIESVAGMGERIGELSTRLALSASSQTAPVSETPPEQKIYEVIDKPSEQNVNNMEGQGDNPTE